MCVNSITDEDLMGRIASKLTDYRYPPQGGMNIAHVSRWIQQFDQADRRFVLEETDRLMGLGYIRESAYHNTACQTASEPGNEQVFSNAAFLDIQVQGSSQHEYLDLLQSFRENDLNIVNRNSDVHWVHSFHEFVYIDDVSFSGAKAITDLAWFIEHFNLNNINICISFIALHTFSEWKIKDQLESQFSDRNIRIGVGGGDFGRIENQRRNSSQSGVFWPKAESVSMPLWATETLNYRGTYRDGYIANNIFPDENRRDRFEAILTKIGFMILGYSQTRSPVIKPLGFSTFRGVGFGGTIFTFRNCPNNAPLAFWWGTYHETGQPALDCWYPLMRRNGYNA